MEIRKTTTNDIDAVMDVFAAAKRYMRANGNASQRGDDYPTCGIAAYDIARGSSYVLTEHGEIAGTFALIIGEDESYRVIEDGAWRLDKPYGTIHRLASNGKAHGVSKLLRRADRLSAHRHTRGQPPDAAAARKIRLSALRYHPRRKRRRRTHRIRLHRARLNLFRRKLS